ncbi:MAG: hypothetical protein F4Z00_12425 [Acidimicrobiaceae bacterium]|nr:hypothetical protein [Acidimicrobiaceae bacterium]MXZ66333.1 hypothetical protein [Acidimicrobiaceae bacterium]MYF32309.1 hypothetical protein [Acidimicrobiaceae bacterium]
MKVAPNLYWKPAPPSSFTGKVHGPSWVLIGWEVAGPHAAALGWHGANLVGWSNQIALQHVEFAVPGEPSQRQPHPRVTIRSRKNLRRRDLTRLEATYLEAVIGFDRWCEGGWDQALSTTKIRLERSAENGEELPRADAVERVAEYEWLRTGRDQFRSRMRDLVGVMTGCDQRAGG